MNIEYKYDTGDKTIIVSNEQGELSQKEYQDNIKELLIEENIIEDTNAELNTLKSNEKVLKEKLQNLLKKIEKKKVRKKKAIIGTLMILLGGPICTMIISSLLFDNSLVNTIFGPINQIYFHGIWGSVLAIIFSGIYINGIREIYGRSNPNEEYEETQKLLKKVQIDIDSLNQILEQAKKRYEDLQIDKSKDNETKMQSNNQIMRVEYRNILNQRKAELQSMYNHESFEDSQASSRKLRM